MKRKINRNMWNILNEWNANKSFYRDRYTLSNTFDLPVETINRVLIKKAFDCHYIRSWSFVDYIM